MSKHTVTTRRAPAAVGPYNQAVVYDQMVFCSGQIGLLPDSGDMAGQDVSSQLHQTMRNLGEVLKAAGSDWNKVIKCTVYLSDMKDFAEVNEIYGRYFPENPPAREAVAVKSLPKNALVEVSCIAHR